MHYGGGGLAPEDDDDEDDEEDDDEDEEEGDNEPAAPPKKRVGRPPKGSSMGMTGDQYGSMAGNAMGLSLPRGAGGSSASTSHEPLKLRRKRAGSGGTAIEAAAVLASMLEPGDDPTAGAGSIIKRRKGRAGELQIMVPGAAGRIRQTIPLHK